MPGFLSFFGLGGGAIRKALQKGGTIVDVRSAQEFDRGHIPNSVNIPFRELDRHIAKFKQYPYPVIFCCDGEGKSKLACNLFRKGGITKVIDGGKWGYVLHIYQKLIG